MCWARPTVCAMTSWTSASADRVGWRWAREQLQARGLALILDYVPNHIAADHPWVTDRPECLLAGSEDDLLLHPEAFMRIAGGVYAKGRDPYFEPWQDVLQLNAFAPALRRAAAETLATIGGQCDGVRCDMAMLMTDEVFARTRGKRAGSAPDTEYWPPLIARCKETHPDFVFIAEVYWDMERRLQQQGFDLCYDKRLYDRPVHDSPELVRDHLWPPPTTRSTLSGSSRTTTSLVRRSRSDSRTGAPPRW